MKFAVANERNDVMAMMRTAMPSVGVVFDLCKVDAYADCNASVYQLDIPCKLQCI